MHLSNVLPICRIDWRPSRGLAIALAMLGLLTALSLALSALPISMAIALGVGAMVYSTFLIRQELQQEPFVLVWAGGESAGVLNFASRTQSLSGPSLSFRGPLVSLRGLDDSGRRQRYMWWPDTLPSAARRQLRLLDQIRTQSPILASTPTAA